MKKINRYSHSSELEDKVLKLNDIVEFHLYNIIIRYRCDTCFLDNMTSNDNSEIFKQLDLIDVNKFVTDKYGYNSSTVCKFYTDGYAWPESEYHDYEALTRLVIALFKLCEKVNKI